MELSGFKMIEHPEIAEGKYMVNKEGIVYSLLSNRPLNINVTKDGYARLSLQTRDRSKRRQSTWTVHKLVMMTFVGNPPEEMRFPTIDHIDGNPLNNNLSNLRYMEWKDNASNRLRTNPGSSNGRSKLNESDVLEICKLIQSRKYGYSEIGRKYGVSGTTIRNIKEKRLWASVTKDIDMDERSDAVL